MVIRVFVSRYGDYSIFLPGLAHVYLSNQHPLSLVLSFSRFSFPPLDRHVAATVFLFSRNPRHNLRTRNRTVAHLHDPAINSVSPSFLNPGTSLPYKSAPHITCRKLMTARHIFVSQDFAFLSHSRSPYNVPSRLAAEKRSENEWLI